MKKILIIEDNQEIAELEQDFLEANAIESDIETDGIKGLDRALHGTYDLILLDIMLPGMDGFHICKRIRAEKEVPILMVSAKREDIDKIRGLGLGADDYIIAFQPAGARSPRQSPYHAVRTPDPVSFSCRRCRHPVRRTGNIRR